MGSTGKRIGKLRWLLLLAVALMVAVNEFSLAPVLADLKQQMGVVAQVPEDDARRQMFRIWHGAAAVLHLLTTLCAGVLVALGAHSPGREPVTEET